LGVSVGWSGRQLVGLPSSLLVLGRACLLCFWFMCLVCFFDVLLRLGERANGVEMAGSYVLFTHMMAQRRKVLRGSHAKTT
jgi:uncharacterized protein YhhL (DUF1145 family)